MKRFLLLVTIVCAAIMSSCDKYDDSKVWDTLNDHENRIQHLEEICAQLNTNISSLQTIVNALQQKDYITNVAPISKDGKEVGYTITFSGGKSITIYHGNDGKDGQDGTDGEDGTDGHTPIIGVKQASDGVYYWTVDGNWLLDADGNKIKAQSANSENGEDGEDGADGADGKDGKDGKDGITPQLKIEDDYWYVSYDEGKSWTKLGKASGEDGTIGSNGTNGKDGDSFFQDITEDDKCVYFVLADGTTLAVAKWAELQIFFDLSSMTEVKVNSEVKVDYTVTGSADKVEIEVMPSNDLRAEAVADDASNKSGHILIRTGSSFDSASKVVVLVSDGDKVVMKSISLQVVADDEAAQLYVYNGATKNVGAAGGAVTLSFLTNVDCEAVIPDDAKSWISVAGTRALENKHITLTVAQNTSDRRSAKVKVQSLDGKLSVEYTISQAGTASSSTPDIDDDGTILGTPAGNEIFYTSTDGKVVEPKDGAMGAAIVSNTYDNGIGVIVFDREITKVGDYTFDSRGNLKSISLPNSVTEIGIATFRGCSSLSNVTIPDSVTKIGTDAFKGCNSLSNITIPNSVIVIGDGAFYGCNGLTNITIPDSVTHLGTSVFTLSGEGVFKNCTSLTSVIIGNNVKYLDIETFYGCTALRSIIIPDSVTEIGYKIFYGCQSLTKVVIGSGVKEIGYSAFENCYSLNEIICNPTTPPTGGSNMFKSIGTSAKIYVPVGSGAAYKAANYWSDYASMIEEKAM